MTVCHYQSYLGQDKTLLNLKFKNQVIKVFEFSKMEFLPKNELLEFHPDTLQVVRKMYNLDKPGEMDDAIDILDAWVKQQKHFKKTDFSRGYLERMIITAKGSIERAKGRMDKLCTMRNLMPHMFGDFHIRDDFKDVAESGCAYAPLPKLTNKHERIYMVLNASKNGNTANFLNGFKQCAMMVEYLKAYDYAASYMFVVDIRECNITNFVTQVGVMDFRNVMTIITEGYGVRLTGIHLLSNLKILDALLILLRQVMSEKIGKRIYVHRSLESLYEYAPKEVLPKEYGEGGEDRTLMEINEKWLEVLSREKYREYHREMLQACTDENLRQTDKFNDQYMGMPGTFRTLKVD